jgi:2-dehydropantoate 2-reductase
MKIAMIGSGAAGSVFASYLRRGGADLFLVDRYKAHMDKVAQDGMTFITPEGQCCLTGFCTCASAEELPIMDIIILMVKATQTDDVMKSVMSCVGPDSILISLQNGLGNDETLMKYVPADRIMYGSGVIGTELPAPGVCVSKPEAGIQMFFGAAEKSEATDRAGQYLEKCFKDGGCNASFEVDVRPYIWKKPIMNSGYNTVSTVLRLKVGEVLADEHGRCIVTQVWKEGCAVAKAAGIIDLWPIIEADTQNLIDNLGNYYPSMAQDVLINQRQTEISV